MPEQPDAGQSEAEFSRDQVDQFGVLDRRDCRFFVQSELLEYQACGRGQNAVATGDVLGELTQSSCVDSSARFRRR